jgi:hypothetical protein
MASGEWRLRVADRQRADGKFWFHWIFAIRHSLLAIRSSTFHDLPLIPLAIHHLELCSAQKLVNCIILIYQRPSIGKGGRVAALLSPHCLLKGPRVGWGMFTTFGCECLHIARKSGGTVAPMAGRLPKRLKSMLSGSAFSAAARATRVPATGASG